MGTIFPFCGIQMVTTKFPVQNLKYGVTWNMYRTSKPEPTLFLEPLYRAFQIAEKGILVDIPTKSSDTISKIMTGILIAGIFCLPARCLVSGRGKYGCVKYFQSGETFKTACGGNVWKIVSSTKMILVDLLEIMEVLR